MVLPNKDAIKDVRNLITEITGFEEDEENFYICEQYCLSHIMHHSYPSINKYEVKKLIDGYVYRFSIHGYFKVADGLNAEVKKFLSHELLFKKNPEFNIEWMLLGLVTALATNLTSVTKLPKVIPIDENEKPIEEINWGEYLKEGLPTCTSHSLHDETDSDNSFYSQLSGSFEGDGSSESDKSDNEKDKEREEEAVQESAKISKGCNVTTSRQHIIDELVKRRQDEISYKRDVVLRGNFIEELGFFVNGRPMSASPQILSEFEIVGYVLNQILTGQNILRRKGITHPTTCSLTEGTIKSYMSSIQPYVNMITVFKEFSNEISLIESGEFSPSANNGLKDGRSYNPILSKVPYEQRNSRMNIYSNINKMNINEKKTVPNVVRLYNLALNEALRSFENKILTMSEFQSSYTLLQILHELRPSFNDLSSLFAVHLSAITNWLNEPNWLCSVRIIGTLYKAVLNSTSNRMGFLFMNMLLFCFQAYLDITDNWISCLSLNDPHEEYVIYRSKHEENEGNGYTYNVHPYAEQLNRMGIKKIPVLDYLANKMVHVGHSIDVLHRMDRSIIKGHFDGNSSCSHESLYKQLLRSMKRDLREMEERTSKAHLEATELNFLPRTLNNADILSMNHNESQNDLSDNNNTNSSTDVFSFETARDSSYKETMSIDSDSTVKVIALDDFCMKLCENDKTNSIQKSIWPLGVKIDTNVKDIINSRVLNTCAIAKNIVVNEFQLKIHLQLLRDVFLFNDPHLILTFMSTLFREESLRQNSYVLTALLQECIEARYKDQARHWSVTIHGNYDEPPKNFVETIDKITIHYQVHWPLQLIFTSRIMALYNDVFRHLFKLHWAHESLCKLKFSALDKNTPEIIKSSRRRLELLRFWCLSSLAQLRSYFIAQISTPFDLQLNSYQHLKHIIKAHEDFVEKIHSRSLLNDDNSEANDLIFNVLIPLCCEVYRYWSTPRFVPDSKLTRVECVFLESQRRFSRLMSALEVERNPSQRCRLGLPGQR